MKLSRDGLKTTVYYAVLAVGVIARLIIAVNGEPFWYDESFSAVVAQLPMDRLLVATSGDVHPPLYYLLLHVWLLDDSPSIEIQARSLSFLLGLLAWCLFNVLLTRLGLSEDVQMLSSALAMWLPSLVFFSAEARMYSLLSLVILGALCLLWQTTCRFVSVEIARHVAAGVLIGLACLTHNVGLIYAPVIAISALVYRLRRGDIPRHALASLMICSGVSMLIWAPWFSTFISQLQSTASGYWTQLPGPGSVAYNLYMALCYRLSEPAATVSMLVIAAMTTTGAVLMLRYAPETLIMVAGVLLLLVVVSYATSTGVLLHRSMVPLGFMVVIGWALVIARQKVAVIPIGAVCLIAASLMLTDGRYEDLNYDLWANLPAQPGDIIYANNSASTPLILYADMPIYVANKENSLTGLSQQTLEAIGTPMVALEEIPWTRAWFCWYEIPQTDDHERAYRDEILERYPGDLYYSDSGDFFKNELWLLQNGVHTLD